MLKKIRRKRQISPILFTIVILILFSIAVFAIFSIINTEDFVEANVLRVSENTIIVGYNCTAIVAETSEERAESIDQGIRGVIENRPNTHDTLVAILKSFNITLDRVQIEGFRENYYFSSLILRSGDKVLKLDTKPSDAIAIAVRLNTSVYLNKTLLIEKGQNIC